MLDTHGRKFVEPLIEKASNYCAKVGLTANQITVTAFIVGVGSGLMVLAGQTLLAVAVLWLSGFLDAVDGSLARKTKTSPWGTVLDVTFDRIVEISIILALAYTTPKAAWALLLLCSAIIISMTVFLTVGAVSEKKGMKSFYYQAGLAERTEGFIMFSMMILFKAQLIYLTLIFFGLILFTVGQRLWEAKKIL